MFGLINNNVLRLLVFIHFLPFELFNFIFKHFQSRQKLKHISAGLFCFCLLKLCFATAKFLLLATIVLKLAFSDCFGNSSYKQQFNKFQLIVTVLLILAFVLLVLHLSYSSTNCFSHSALSIYFLIFSVQLITKAHFCGMFFIEQQKSEHLQCINKNILLVFCVVFRLHLTLVYEPQLRFMHWNRIIAQLDPLKHTRIKTKLLIFYVVSLQKGMFTNFLQTNE